LTPTERELERARAFEAAEDVAVQETLSALDARKAEVEAAAAEVAARREAIGTEVPEEQRRYYERLRLIRWPCAVPYNRVDGVCTGCNLVQPPSVTQMVLHADKKPDAKLVYCPSCGRILY
jgi:predicted  nucleic acid-binding Zn-ribbon protein